MGALKVWDGSSWQTVSQSGPEGTVWVGTDAPATADDGDLWYDTDDTSSMLTLPLAVADGGTGATNAATARTNLVTNAGGQSASIAGAPAAGVWARGDTWLDSANVLWVCTAGGTPGAWASTNRGEELAYNQTVSGTNLTNGSASPHLLIEGTSRIYDGSPIFVEVYFAIAQPPAAANTGTYVSLHDAGTDLGIIAEVYSGSTGGTPGAPIYGKRRIVPTAGTHNYRVMGWVGSGTGMVYAGPGGSGSAFPAGFIRVTRA